VPVQAMLTVAVRLTGETSPGHHRSSSSAPALGGRVPAASRLACGCDHRAGLAHGRAAPPPLVAV